MGEKMAEEKSIDKFEMPLIEVQRNDKRSTAQQVKVRGGYTNHVFILGQICVSAPIAMDSLDNMGMKSLGQSVTLCNLIRLHASGLNSVPLYQYSTFCSPFN